MNSPTDAEKKDIAKIFLSDEAAKVPEEYGAYFTYYNTLFSKMSGDHVLDITTPAYSSHGSVILFFNTLIRDTSHTKTKFSSFFAASVDIGTRDYAIRALLKASLMIDCAPKETSRKGNKVIDFVPRPWEQQQSFAQFVERCFPSPTHSQRIRNQIQNVLEQRRKLKAWKLKSRNLMVLLPTDNLAEHLVFDPKLHTLLIFRQVGFLEAHLYRSHNEDLDTGFQESLEKGTLPRQLLLEVLHSIQYVLFPNDARSTKLLGKFIKKYDFDPKAMSFENHTRTPPDEFEYEYLGNRLITLSRSVDKPINSLIAWFQKHENKVPVLTAILGVYFTVAIGLVSIYLSIRQYDLSVKQYDLAVLNSESPQIVLME